MDLDTTTIKEEGTSVSTSGNHSLGGDTIIVDNHQNQNGQAGPSSVTFDSPSSKEKENPSTMGDQEVPGGEQTTDDNDNRKPGGSSASCLLSTTAGTGGTAESGIEQEEDEVGGGGEGEGEEITIPASIIFNRTNDRQDECEYNRDDDTVKEESTEEEEEEEIGLENIPHVDEMDMEKETEQIVEDDVEGSREFKGKKDLRPCKAVLRMLPPKITTQEFIEYVSPLPEYDYVQVDRPEIGWGPNARAVAHINFKDPEDAVWFIERFTGYQFLDENGEEYITVGDYAMNQKIFWMRPQDSGNPDRGKLLQSEEFQDFLRQYNDNPFQFAVGLPPKEVITAEEMLVQIENRSKQTGSEPTPLTEFVLNKTVRKERERQLKREKEKERRKFERQKRDKERERDREQKKRDKRERRERERKEKREKERLEKEGKAKGMRITVSKSGNVTRWSANSSPFTKKLKEDAANQQKSEEPTTKDEKVAETAEESSVSNVSSTKLADALLAKKSPANPFSKDAKKHEKVLESKFGKPFPVKPTSVSESSRTSKSEGREETKKEDPVKCDDVTVSNGELKGKKKVIRKIIRVKKIRKGGNGEEGGEEVVETKIISQEVVAGSSKSSNNSNGNGRKPNVEFNAKGLASTSSSKQVSQTESTNASQSASFSGSKKDVDPKKRRNRPDVQIYRPGSLRNSARDRPRTDQTDNENGSENNKRTVVDI